MFFSLAILTTLENDINGINVNCKIWFMIIKCDDRFCHETVKFTKTHLTLQKLNIIKETQMLKNWIFSLRLKGG